jgi:tetratricopeptide (TPR) repeat protein
MMRIAASMPSDHWLSAGSSTALMRPCLAILLGFLCLFTQVLADERGEGERKKASADSATEQTHLLVAELIEQLGDENFRVRSNAMASLDRIGLLAFEQLYQALDHPNIQVALSAEYLLFSQNVVWWLDTDSQEVRERLQDYSSLLARDRQTRLQELALIGTDDALIALCRIAKFESHEWISRAAALYLLESLLAVDEARLGVLCQSILLVLDRTDRTATQWLSTFARQRLDHVTTDLEVWKRFADELTLEVSQNQRVRGEQKLLVLKYYEWLTEWALSRQSRDATLEMVRPSMKLVEPNPYAVREYGYWALQVKLPELIVDLSEVHRAFFENDQELSYLLAEAYLHSGDQARAEELAQQALQLPQTRNRLLGQLARGNASEIEAARRETQARRLRERGLFDWAEAEYRAAIELQSRGRDLLRVSLAEFFWEGGQYDKAAAVLEQVAQSDAVERDLPGSLVDHAIIVAHYNWYRALQAAKEGSNDLATNYFQLALEANATASSQNPDILIALFRQTVSEEDRKLFRVHFDAMVDRYRSLVAAEEARLAQSNFGQFANAGADLAEYCNQLAWLLSNCQSNSEEAIYLSRRSLEYYPDIPAYLDTMARCAFAAGELDLAIETQRKAVAKAPYDRMMKIQLAEFEAALEASRRIQQEPAAAQDQP